MPKQVVKLEQFHGGLSTNSDPRDVAVNELTAAVDVMVDELGKIRTLGGAADHDAASNPVVTIEPGYGLFQFSHDRTGGHVQVSDLSGTHTGSANQDGTASNPLVDSVADFPVDSLIGATLNNTTDGSSGTIDDNDATTASVDDLTGGTGDDWDASDVYTITDFPETGEDYLVLANTAVFTDATCDYNNDPTIAHDDDSGAIKAGMAVSGTGIPTGAYVATATSATAFELSAATTGGSVTNGTLTFGGGLQIYAQKNDKWSTGAIINLGATTGMKPTFYTVDGALRISDGNFGSTNSNKWYGYIKRDLFSEISPSYDINQWYVASQKVSAPNKSTWDDNATFAAGFGGTSTQAGSGTTDQDVLIVENTLDNDCVNVIKAEVTYTYTVETSGSGVSITFEVGTYTSAFLVSQVEILRQFDAEPGIYTGILTFYFDATDTATTADGGTAYDSFNAHITAASGVSSQGITNLVCHESGTSPDHSSRLSNNNIHIDFDWETATGASGWNNVDNTGEWKVGVTFIYDGKQESQITTLVDAADDNVSSFVVPGSLGITAAPSIRLFIADFQTVSTAWNKRITGCNIYMQDVAQDITQPWFLQLSADFENGKLKVENSQKEYGAKYYAEATQEYYYWELGEGDPPDESVMLIPANVITYGINSGLLEDEKSVLSKYKTAVVVGRIVYIGGLEFQNEDGSTEVRGDAMIKSPVNKFDLFPLSRLIEVSVQDGDNIIKLEEYADRILQFKKNKMHLINVSQELEFLEDTFVHKGVSHAAATCKTDFGIAWVNKLGCYLYDGQKVTNLLEKQGRQIIKESDWITFTANEPMIGYIPKKRQLILVDDNTSTGDGSIFLYDLVTQSWIKGAGATFRSVDLTNFVTDWNGDLVHAHTTGTILKWDDASDTSAKINLMTKDIDFGQPSVRKKVYRVYLTFRGDATHVQIHYGKDGLAPVLTFNTINSDGSSTGSGSLAKCIPINADVDDWLKAELKPSASVNNISSFRLKISGDDSNPIAADFEINDISIVYRLKNIK